jgi:hypothetical protein
MSYTKQNFTEGMVLKALHLEKLEEGILGANAGKVAINRNIHFVGMSIWWSDGNGRIGYQTLLKEYFDFNKTTNHCYSGHSLGGLDSTDVGSIMNRSSGWTGKTGDIWTLDTITNDFKRNVSLGTFEDYENATGIATYYGALRAFKDRVTELSGDTAIVICSNSLKRNHDGYTSTSANSKGHTLLDYEYALMKVAAKNNWYFVDQYRLSGITDETIMLTTSDGLHLNNFGYTLAVKPWIEQLNIVARKLPRSADNGLDNETSANIEWIQSSFINAEGAFTNITSTSWLRTDYIEVQEGQTWKYIGNTSVGGGAMAVYGYNESKSPVEVILDNVQTTGTEFVIPSGVSYIACSSYGTSETCGIVRIS